MGTPLAYPQVRLTRQFLSRVELTSHQLDQQYTPDANAGWAIDVGLAWGRTDAMPNQVIGQLAITLKYPEGAPQPPPIELSFEMVGIFAADQPLKHEQAEAFAVASIVQSLWPYVQETVAALTLRAGGPVFAAPPLPTPPPS